MCEVVLYLYQQRSKPIFFLINHMKRFVIMYSNGLEINRVAESFEVIGFYFFLFGLCAYICKRKLNNMYNKQKLTKDVITMIWIASLIITGLILISGF